MSIVHTGATRVEGTTDHRGVTFVGDVSDNRLAAIYRAASFVGALRYVEGFEMGAAEGMCCGARALLFDQEATRQWHGGAGASFVDENLSDQEMEDALVHLMQTEHAVSPNIYERRTRYDWQPIVSSFWNRLLTNIGEGL